MNGTSSKIKRVATAACLAFAGLTARGAEQPESMLGTAAEACSDTTAVCTELRHKGWHLSTNAVAWAMAVTNITAEWDFMCHWSVALTVNYSGWNYGSATRKFRIFQVRPEMRWWPRRKRSGFFMDAHLSFAYYNFALPGWEYRIQDRKARHPAPGGGIGAGYRIDLGKSGRWSLDGAVGCGIYSLKYDRFENRENGPFVDRVNKFWFGIDNVAISLVYNFK
ncbi:MAG: DUF3575 domain-containing protein [Candidatus Amulumruptor caecigallinarius]|nr:DUF3575 domain-containing protein [Candidatus Amulumruptor caecigallinarius]